MAVKKAEAERQAADLQYQAKLRLAEGDAPGRRSSGPKANGRCKMVDVNVEREQRERRAGPRRSRAPEPLQQAGVRGGGTEVRAGEAADRRRPRRPRSPRPRPWARCSPRPRCRSSATRTTMAGMAQQFMRAASIGTADRRPAEDAAAARPGTARQAGDVARLVPGRPRRTRRRNPSRPGPRRNRATGNGAAEKVGLDAATVADVAVRAAQAV